MSNIRIISKFTKSERERLAKIQNIYTQTVNGTLPNYLTLDAKKRPIHAAGVRDFVPDSWISQMGNGAMRPNCQYERERSERFFGSGYRDDPYVLFLEEFKDWLTKTISVRDCNHEARDDLRGRIRYLELILVEPDLFDPFPAHKVTMQQVVFHVRKVLLYEMLPLVETEIAHSSAREDIRRMQLAIRAALDHLMRFLYCIFRNGGGPSTITVGALRQPNGEKTFKILENRSGLLLHRLASTGLLTAIFRDEHFYFEEETENARDGIKKGNREIIDANDFFDARGDVRVPKWLLEMEEDPKERAKMTLENCFGGDNSGFEPFFRNNSMISSVYLRCFGLCQELAKLVLICENAHRLAGTGGDLLVYGVANAQVNLMLTVYENLAKAVRSVSDRLNQIAEIRFEQMVNDNTAREFANKWVKYFKKVSGVLQLFREDLIRADDAASHVRMQANSMTLKERLVKAKAETMDFVTQTDHYARHISGILGIEYRPATVPQTFTMENALSTEDAPFGRSLMMPNEDGSGWIPLNAATPLKMIAAPPANPLKATGSSGLLTPNNEELIMVKNNISDSNIARVFIRLTPAVTKVSLENNHITGSGALELFEHLAKYCPRVASVGLYNNDLGSEGARALAAALTRPDHSLQKLDLNSNDIGDDGAIYLIQGLRANHSLTYLDIAYNGITDSGIDDLPEVISDPECVLKFLKMSGNNFSARVLKPILTIFETNQSFIQIDIGDANENVPEDLINKFKSISHTRKRQWDRIQEAAWQEEQRKLAEPKLKPLEPQAVRPQLKIKSPLGKVTVEEEPSGSPATSDDRPTIQAFPDPSPSSSSNSQYYMEEDDDLMTDRELSVADYYSLIRIIQILIPVCKTKEYGCVSKKVLKKAFECSAYGSTIPLITMTFEEYYEAARTAGVIDIREIKKKGSPSKVGLSLADQWKDYKVPKPDNIVKVTVQSWHLFILCCKAKPTAIHKKSSLLTWAKTLRPELQKCSEDVLNAMIETAIYSGTVLKEGSKFTPNLHQKVYPIDRSVCPPFEL